MKKFIISAVFLTITTILYSEQYSDLKSAIETISGSSTKNITSAMSLAMPFYTGSANMSDAGIFTFGQWSAGLGFGCAVNPSLFSSLGTFNSLNELKFSDSVSITNSIDKIVKLVPVIPLPYDTVYGKIGLPITNTDAGLRVGIIPMMNLNANGTMIAFGGFHLGGEIRHEFYEFADGLIKIDGRLSADYDSGYINISASTNQVIIVNGNNMGTNLINMQFKYNWMGFSIGSRAQASIYKKGIGGFYLGMGIGLNPGNANSSLDFNIQFKPSTIGILEDQDTISQKSEAGYRLFDFRFYTGFQLFFFQMSAEYGLPSGYFAVTLYPVILSF